PWIWRTLRRQRDCDAIRLGAFQTRAGRTGKCFILRSRGTTTQSRTEEEMPAKRAAQPIGLASVAAGPIGLIRPGVAVKHPNVGWIGFAEIRTDRGNEVAERVRADFCTTDYRELLARPEVTAAVIATDEHLHVDPILAAVERGLPLLIEKPLATELAESERVLRAIQKSGVDAVVGYTQRFRRRWLTAKEKVRTGQLGEVTLVTSRAFMNRLVALDNYQRTN